MVQTSHRLLGCLQTFFGGLASQIDEKLMKSDDGRFFTVSTSTAFQVVCLESSKPFDPGADNLAVYDQLVNLSVAHSLASRPEDKEMR